MFEGETLIGEGSGGGSGEGSGGDSDRLHLPKLRGIRLPTLGPAAINGLKPFASQALHAIDILGRSISSLAGAGSALLSGLQSRDLSAVISLFSEMLDGTSDMVTAVESIELNSFEKDEITDIIKMHHGLRNLRDLLKADLADIKRFITNPQNGLADFKRIANQFGACGTIAGFTGVSLNYILHYADYTDTGDQRTAATAKATATVSRTTPTSWLLTTVLGTSIKAFEDFVAKLPDGGSGRRIVFPALKHQSYVAKMTLEEAKAVSKDPIVDQLGSNEPMKMDGDMIDEQD